MNFRSVKIAFIPEEYCDLVRKSQKNREAFLNIETLKTILSPSEVDFYTALNTMGVSFGDKAVLYPNAVIMPKGYDFPDSATYAAKTDGREMAARIKDRLFQVFQWGDRANVNRQFLLESLANGVIPSSELSLSVAYVDPTCLFLSFSNWDDNRQERLRRNLDVVYTGLHQCNLFELAPSIQEAAIKSRYSYDNSMRSWHYFCGTILDMLVAYEKKVN